LGIKYFFVEGTKVVPAGKHQLRMEFAYDGGGLGKGGSVSLFIDGQNVGEGRVESLREDRDLTPRKPQRGVAQEGAGDQPGLGKDLETVADAQHEPVGRGEVATARMIGPTAITPARR
jgi:hypothetical protein